MFTTRPDTLFGATFMVLAPEHPLVADLTDGAEAAQAVLAYKRQAAARKDVDRQDDDRVKTGVFTGTLRHEPGHRPGHPDLDRRLRADGLRDRGDHGRAVRRPARLRVRPRLRPRHPGHPAAARRVVRGARHRADAGHAPLAGGVRRRRPVRQLGQRRCRPERHDSVDDGIAAINAWLEAEGVGEATITYKLRDWLFSRQRYWGEPFPIVYDVDGRPAPAARRRCCRWSCPTPTASRRGRSTPTTSSPSPESPLDRLDDWVEVTLDIGDGEQVYRRDTNVMPQWAGSCWYELRYCDPTNENAFVDPEVERYWMGPQTDLRPDHPGGVDLYVGGVEHAVLHLLYARFWHKVLFDLGYVSSYEPYARLFNQGYVLAAAYTDDRGMYVEAARRRRRAATARSRYDGQPVDREWGKMGKSLKNAVSPEEIYDAYGSDTLRCT